MELIEKLTLNELDAMRSYIAYYGEANGEGLGVQAASIPIEHILRFWKSAKTSLFNVFGQELILSKKISFTKPKADLELEIQNKVLSSWEGKGYAFTRSFYDWIYGDFSGSIDVNTSYYLRTLLDPYSLAENVYHGPDLRLTVEGSTKPLMINKGCKIIRALSKIASTFNIEGFEDFRLAHSMCLNQKKSEGELCLSIHPLDYMTMSDNECDWSSCMSWQEGGDYRQGTVEMMNSPCVVIAYLKSKDDMMIATSKGENVPWSNKRWRQLYIVDPNLVMSIKPYPYVSEELDTYCLEWLQSLVDGAEGYGTYHPQMCQLKNHSDIPLEFLNKTVSFRFIANFMYNDIYSTHNAFVNVDIPERVEINYSGKSECMWCGAEITEDPEDDTLPTSSLLCSGCGHFCSCDECGRPLDPDDVYHVDNYCLCSCCCEDYTASCDICEEWHYESNLTPLCMVHEDRIVINELEGPVICNDCLGARNFATKYGKLTENSWHCHTCIDTKDLTEKGWKLFGYASLEDRAEFLKDIE